MIDEIVVDATLPGGLWRWFAPRVDVAVILALDPTELPETIGIIEPAGRSRLRGPFVDGCEIIFTTGWYPFGGSGVRSDVITVDQDSKILYVEYWSRSALPMQYLQSGISFSYVDVAPDEPVERLRFPKDLRHSRNR